MNDFLNSLISFDYYDFAFDYLDAKATTKKVNYNIDKKYF